jgi:hypothetical protein
VFSEQTFASRWESYVPHLGPVQSIDWGHRTEFDVIKGTQTKRTAAYSAIKFEKFPEPARQPIVFVLRDGEWLIDDIQQVFTRPKPPGETDDDSVAPDPRAPQGPIPFGPGPSGNPAGEPAAQ